MDAQVRRISTIASAILAGSLLLSGCGGGSSTSTLTAAGTTLTGTAVDELILDGVVEVRANSAGGTVIGSGRTDDKNGTYKIDVDGFEGVAIVSVTCDENSSLFFPDTNTTKACPTTTQLFSAAPVEKDKEVTVNIAPSTHIMFMMATSGDPNATLDKSKVEQARVAAAQIFGTDPITSDPTTGLYAKVIEAFHTAATENNLTIQELVEIVAEDASDGVLGDDSNLTDTLARKMKENNVTTPFVEAAENNTTYTPQVPDNAGSLDDVGSAKAFFQNLRTQGDDLFKSGGLFDKEAKAMDSLFVNVTLNGDLAAAVIGNLADAIDYGIQNSLIDVNTTFVTLTNGDTRKANLTRTDTGSSIWNYTITDTIGGAANQRGSGTITLPAPDPTTIDPNGFTSLSMSFSGTLPANKLFESTQNLQTLQANISLTKTSDGASLNVSDINLSTADGTLTGLKGVKADIGYNYNSSNTTDPFTLNYVKLNELTLNGALDQNYTATGTMSVGYTLNQSMADKGGLSIQHLTNAGGHVGCSNPADPINPYVDYSNQSFDITMIDNSVYTFFTDIFLIFFETIAGVYTFIDLSFAAVTFNGTCSNGGNPQIDSLWTTNENNYTIGNSGYLPSSMTFSGSLKNVQTETEVAGTMGVTLLNASDINVTANEEPHARVTLSGTLKRAGLDDMSLNLAYEFDPATNENNSTFAYVYGAMTVNANGRYNDTTRDGNISLTTGNGLALTVVIDNGNIDYNATTPLTKDGRVIGTLDNSTGIDRIKYIDGSFESLY